MPIFGASFETSTTASGWEGAWLCCAAGTVAQWHSAPPTPSNHVAPVVYPMYIHSGHRTQTTTILASPSWRGTTDAIIIAGRDWITQLLCIHSMLRLRGSLGSAVAIHVGGGACWGEEERGWLAHDACLISPTFNTLALNERDRCPLSSMAGSITRRMVGKVSAAALPTPVVVIADRATVPCVCCVSPLPNSSAYAAPPPPPPRTSIAILAA